MQHRDRIFIILHGKDLATYRSERRGKVTLICLLKLFFAFIIRFNLILYLAEPLAHK